MVKKTLFTILILAIVGFCFVVYFADITTAPVSGPAETALPVETTPPIEITLPADAIPVSSNEEIIVAVSDTIEAGESFVNFDVSRIDETTIYTDSVLSNMIKTKHPEYQYVAAIDSAYNGDLHLLSIMIDYNYFFINRDVFYVVDRPGLYLVLDKKILPRGETLTVDLRGENAAGYKLDVSSAGSSLMIDEDNHIETLWEGIAYLRATIVSKSNSEEEYIHTFKVRVLPGIVPHINDIGELVAVAKDNLGRTSCPIYICCKNLTYAEMQNALNGLGEEYVTCTLDPGMTSIENYTYTDYSLPECAKRLAAVEEKAEEIVSEIVLPDMSELEKETVLYDYLIQNTEYDNRVYDNPENCPIDSSTSYGPLIDNLGICSGYAYALKALLTEAGIECITVEGVSEGEGHMWNIAKIDGVYYQMDPTFDSGYTHWDGVLSHEYFNITDKQMKRDHFWDASAYPTCIDTRYE